MLFKLRHLASRGLEAQRSPRASEVLGYIGVVRQLFVKGFIKKKGRTQLPRFAETESS